MTEKEVYLELAERFITAASSEITNSQIHEAASFESYHAFESLAGAFNCHLGAPVPRSHAKKLNAFVNNYHHNTLTRIHSSTIAALAITLSSMRNKYLYPHPDGTDFLAPKSHLTLAQATRQISQIKSIIGHFAIALA